MCDSQNCRDGWVVTPVESEAVECGGFCLSGHDFEVITRCSCQTEHKPLPEWW